MAQMTLRLRDVDFDACKTAAARAGKSLNGWAVERLLHRGPQVVTEDVEVAAPASKPAVVKPPTKKELWKAKQAAALAARLAKAVPDAPGGLARVYDADVAAGGDDDY
jgi:hypothetical protein